MTTTNSEKIERLNQLLEASGSRHRPDWAGAVAQLVQTSRALSKTIKAVDLDECVSGAAHEIGALLLSVYAIAHRVGINADKALDEEINARAQCIYINHHELTHALHRWAQLGVSAVVSGEPPRALLLSAIDQTDSRGEFHPEGEPLILRDKKAPKGVNSAATY